jgi:hypothetical protein
MSIAKRVHAAIAKSNRYRRRNLAVIFCVFFLPSFVLAFLSYQVAGRYLTELALARKSAGIVPVATKLDESLDRVVNFAVMLTTHPAVRREILNENWQEGAEILGGMRLFSEDFFIERVGLMNTEGDAMSESPALGVIGRNFAHRDWYQRVIETKAPYVSGVYKRSAEPQYNVVAVAAPIFGDDQRLFAVLMLQIKLDQFLEWVKDVDAGREGVLYIVDQKGQVVSHPWIDPQSPIVDFSKKKSVANVIKGDRGSRIMMDRNTGEEVVTAYEPISHYGWGVVVQQPVRHALEERDFLLTLLLLLHSIPVFFTGISLRLFLSAVERDAGMS